MKKIVYFLAVVFLAFVSCEDSLEETYDNLGNPTDDFGVGQNEYTLIDEDYEAMKVDGEFFNSLEDARNLIPAFLDDKYPNLDDRSLVLVNFDITKGDVVDNYSIMDSDYEGLRSDGFVNNNIDPDVNPITGFERSFSTEDVADYLLEVLQNNIEEPENEDAYQVFFNYFDEEAVVLDNFYEVDLREEAVYNSFETVSVTGDQVWEYSDQYGAVVSGFDSGTDFENEDWLISPEIDLTSATDASITISQAMNFLSGEDRNQILISTNYTTGSDFTMATWNEIEFETKPLGNSWSFVQSELVSIDAYTGQTIHLAFVYDYPDGDTPTWEIGNILIQPNSSDQVDYTYELNSVLLEYSNLSAEWSAQDITELEEEDYDAMGEESGRPGRFNNFSSSIPATDYLPNYLSAEFPFALEEDKVYVKYKFFNGSTIDVIDSYKFIDGAWLNFQEVVSDSIQFGKTGGVWEPDNTIEYILTSPDDYDFIGGELLTTEGFEDAADNVAFFHSFERRESDNEFWSNDMLETGFGILLDDINPEAEIGQKYAITFVTYTGTTGSEIFYMIKNEEGVWEINEEI